MGLGGTIDYLVDAVFNHPTLAEGYKVADLDASNKMRAIARVREAGHRFDLDIDAVAPPA